MANKACHVLKRQQFLQVWGKAPQQQHPTPPVLRTSVVKAKIDESIVGLADPFRNKLQEILCCKDNLDCELDECPAVSIYNSIQVPGGVLHATDNYYGAEWYTLRPKFRSVSHPLTRKLLFRYDSFEAVFENAQGNKSRVYGIALALFSLPDVEDFAKIFREPHMMYKFYEGAHAETRAGIGLRTGNNQ